METDITNTILAVVTLEENRDKVSGGGAPIFFCRDQDELQEVTMLISRLTMSMVHDLKNGVYILVKH